MRKTHYAKTPTVYQMEATECGAASLAMILAYYGCYIPLEKLRIEAGVSRDGCNARNILQAARKYGLECKGYSCSVEQLLMLDGPCIIHWNFNHFVVYEGTKGGHAYINDPGTGRRRLDMEELDQSFTGIVLTFEKTPDFQWSGKRSSIEGFVRKRLKGEKGALGALLCLGGLLLFSGILMPILGQIFVDDILIGRNYSWIGPFLVILLLVMSYNVLFGWLRERLLINLQSKLSVMTGYRTIHHLLRLPISFFEQRYAGDIVSRVNGNESINRYLTGSLVETVLNLLMSVFYLLLMVLYNPVLALIGALGGAAALLVHAVCGRALSSLSTKMQQDSGKLTGTLYAGIHLTATLKAAGAENEYLARILGYCARTSATEQKIGARSQILAQIPQILSQMTNVLVLMVGGIYVIHGRLTAGGLTAFLTLLSSFMSPVTALLSLFQQNQMLQADMFRVEDLESYEESGQFHDTGERRKAEKLTGYEVEEVSFGYSPVQPPLIQHLSFTLKAGRSIAIVGASGSGKSTVGKLLGGLNRPWSGRILLNGIPMEQIDPLCLHANIAVVSQSLDFFSGSIRENLTLWNRYAMESDILSAAKDACIHDVILSLPGEYGFHLTEGASNLSGGQRQRLEIARALAANPSILIMDEATSALDPVMEKEVLNNIRRRGCSCIIIAHRLSAIRDCDEILVMDKGQVAERGTHEELWERNGIYAALIRNE